MNEKLQLPATMALCGAWLWALVSGPVADDPRVGIPVLVVLGVTTLMAVRHVHVRRVDIGATGTVVCVIAFALMMFTVWGQFLAGLATPTLPESLPKAVRLSPLFLIGPMAAGVTALLFAYPLAVLLPRHHWLVPAIAAAYAGLLQFESIVDATTRPLTRILMTLELASLAFLVPLLVTLITRRMRARVGVPAVARGE